MVNITKATSWAMGNPAVVTANLFSCASDHYQTMTFCEAVEMGAGNCATIIKTECMCNNYVYPNSHKHSF